MTPMCTNVKGLDYFEKANQIYPEIHNLENAVKGDHYFSSCGHMNDAGARMFTTIIIKRFFDKKQNCLILK
jgi:glutathionyl-hydroquinone reductase